MKRFSAITVISFILVLISPFFVYASGSTMPNGYTELTDSISDEVKERLPDEVFSENYADVGQAIEKMTDGIFWLDTILDMIRSEWQSAFLLFIELCALLIIASIFGALCRSLSSDALSGAVRFCSTTAIFASIIHIERSHFESVELFFSRLNAMMSAMIPVTGTVWAMGGNVGTASSGTASMYVFLNVCEGIFAKSIISVTCVFTVFALCNALSPDLGLRGLSSTLKKIYTFFMVAVMTILIASLASQTTLTSAADSMTARAGKLISANIIPVVGASIGDALRTVATSAQYLKGVIGIGGVIFIVLLLLPTLLSLLMARLAILLASGVAEMLGCEVEGRFLSELGGVYGIMIAAVSVASVMFIFALTIFTKTVVALA